MSTQILTMIRLWKLHALNQLNSQIGPNPALWIKFIEENGKRNCISNFLEDSKSRIPLRFIFIFYEIIQNITNPEKYQVGNMIKMDKVLVYLFAQVNKNHGKNAEKLNRLKLEIDEAIQKFSSPIDIQELSNDVFILEDLFEDLENDPTFLLMYAKLTGVDSKSLNSHGEVRFEKDFAQILLRVQLKSSLDLDGFNNNKNKIKQTLSRVLLCSNCGNFALNGKNRLSCLHLACSTCQSEKQCSLCPLTMENFWTDTNSYFTSSFVTSAYFTLHKLCQNQIDPFQCNFCINSPDFYCLQCGALYCQDHSNSIYHQEQHLLLSVSDLCRESILKKHLFSYCPIHTSQFTHFCFLCHTCICSHSSCINLHLEHAEFYLSILDEAKIQFEKDTFRIKSNLDLKSAHVNWMMEKFDRNRMEMIKEENRIKDKIIIEFNVFTAQINEAKEKFLDEMNQTVEKCFDETESSRNAMENWILELEKLGSQSHNPDNSWTSLSTIRHSILLKSLDCVQGHLLDEFDEFTFSGSTLLDLIRSIETLESNFISPAQSATWEPFVTISNPQIIDFCVCNDSSYLVQPNGNISGQYLLLHYNATNLSHPASSTIIKELATLHFANLAIDYKTGSVYSAIWRRKKLIDFRSNQQAYLIIQQYTPYLENEKLFILDWFHYRNHDQFSFTLHVFDQFLYINDSESIYELSHDGRVIRSVNLKTTPDIFHLNKFLLNFNAAHVIGFDFEKGKMAKFDWTLKMLDYSSVLNGKNGIIDVATDNYGNYYFLDQFNECIRITDCQSGQELIKIHLPTGNQQSETSSLGSRSSNMKMGSVTDRTELMKMKIEDGQIYVAIAGMIWRRNVV